VWDQLRLIIEDGLRFFLLLSLELSFLEEILIVICWCFDVEVRFNRFSQADLFFIIDGLGKRIQLLLF